MKKMQIAIMGAALLMAGQAHATWYDISFTSGTVSVSGKIDVNSGLATDGHINVSGVSGVDPLTEYALITTPIGVAGYNVFTAGGGENLTYDNVVNYGSDPFLTGYGANPFGGLVFSDGSSGTPGLEGFNLWANGPGSYTLFGTPPWGNPYVSGTASLTLAPVPEPTTIVAGAMLLLPFGMSTLRMLRKSRTA